MLDSKRRSGKRERAFASEIGGRAHPGSGSVWYKKGDASNANHLVEDKFTDKTAYSIKYDTLLKLKNQATKIGKTPIFRFGFEQYKENYVLISTSDYNDYKSDAYYQLPTDKKSINMSLTGLSHLLSNVKDKDIILAEVTFTLYNKKYLLLTWDDFVENQSKFVAA